jgi:predicted acetyltransferase
MGIEIRAIEQHEVEAFIEADRRGFALGPAAPGSADSWARGEIERVFAAFDGTEIVGGARNYSFEVTVPGGGLVPAAAVSWVSVAPTHRRRGIVTSLMARVSEDARERGEPVSILTASEAGIYRRFGFGPATWSHSFEIDRAHGAFHAGWSADLGGRARLIDEAAARVAIPAFYEQVRPAQVGMVSRPEFWWPEVYFGHRFTDGARFFAVYESLAGEVEGIVCYEISGDFVRGLPAKRLLVRELLVTTDRARAGLWRLVLDVDLVATVAGHAIAVDDSLRHLLADGRRLQVTSHRDALWVRLLDPGRALTARTYGSDGRLVLSVAPAPASAPAPALAPSGRSGRGAQTAGTWLLEVGRDHVECVETGAAPDLVLEEHALGSAYLGGTSIHTLAAAGFVHELSSGALTRADRMFATFPAPTMIGAF